jgi:hypothetical protein
MSCGATARRAYLILQNEIAVLSLSNAKRIEFFVNEAIELADPTIANIRFELTTNINLTEKSVELLLSVFFSNETGNVFMKIKTSNIFIVLELANFQYPVKKSFDLPDNILVTLLSLSISHTRALLAKNALGTKFTELYINVV